MLHLVSFGYHYVVHSIYEISHNIFGETIIADTSYGKVKGKIMTSCLGTKYYSFQKIPYAKPPIGELRFRDPVPIEPWETILDATGRSMAPQRNLVLRHATGAEDCLHVNVFTKDISPPEPRPVMVWIHGGAFNYGHSNKEIYSPDFLLQKDIVLVSVHYRLGVLGFLSLDDPELKVPGNAGLKDQCLALKWVKQNVSHFGGDPNNITIFGESAGGASVHYHTISEMSKDLFHKAIPMSGTSLTNWALVPRRNWGDRLAKKLGWDGDGTDEKAIYEFLKKADAAALVKAQESVIMPKERKHVLLFAFGPTIEPYTSEQCFLPEHPALLARKAWSKNVPIMLGGCSDEGLLFYGALMKKPQVINRLGDFEYLVPTELNLPIESEKCIQYGRELKKLYFGYSKPSPPNMMVFCTLLSDKMFWHGITRTMLSRLKYASGPTYLYRFNFDSSTFNHIKLFAAGKNVPGACHGDDCSYLFKNAFSGNLSKNSKEFLTVQRMVAMWTSFAANGDPNNELMDCKWEPIQHPEPFKCLNIADDLKLIDLPETERIKHWNSMYDADQLI